MGGEITKPWNLSVRLIEGIPVDRARLRFTLTYQVTDALRVGVEANPKDDDYGALLNYRVWSEEGWRPALIVGTSSDRIGTPSGRAYYATFSKDVEQEIGLPIAPFIGPAFGEFEDEWRLVGGVNVRWTERITTMHTWDGENLHHMANHAFDGFSLGIVVAQQDSKYYVGGTFNISF